MNDTTQNQTRTTRGRRLALTLVAVGALAAGTVAASTVTGSPEAGKLRGVTQLPAPAQQ